MAQTFNCTAFNVSCLISVFIFVNWVGEQLEWNNFPVSETALSLGTTERTKCHISIRVAQIFNWGFLPYFSVVKMSGTMDGKAQQVDDQSIDSDKKIGRKALKKSEFDTALTEWVFYFFFPSCLFAILRFSWSTDSTGRRNVICTLYQLVSRWFYYSLPFKCWEWKFCQVVNITQCARL